VRVRDLGEVSGNLHYETIGKKNQKLGPSKEKTFRVARKTGKAFYGTSRIAQYLRLKREESSAYYGDLRKERKKKTMEKVRSLWGVPHKCKQDKRLTSENARKSAFCEVAQKLSPEKGEKRRPMEKGRSFIARTNGILRTGVLSSKGRKNRPLK